MCKIHRTCNGGHVQAALAESMLQAKEGAMRNMMTELRALEASKLIPSRALRQVEVAMTRQKTETSRWMDAFVRSRAKVRGSR